MIAPGARCPICGPAERLTLIAVDRPLQLGRCTKCLGVWARLGDVQEVHTVFADHHPILVAHVARARCRKCNDALAPGRDICPLAKHEQTIACVGCGYAMEYIRFDDVILDVCRKCHAAWFDRGELGVIVKRYGGSVRLPDRRAGSRLAGSSTLDPFAGISVLSIAPSWDGAGATSELATQAVAEAGTGVVEGVGSVALETATAAGEAAVSAVGSMLEAVLTGIFDGL